MDSRFDFISFFTSSKTSIYMDENIFNESRNILEYWNKLGYKVLKEEEEKNKNKFIYFYKSRWKRKQVLTNKKSVEYVCIPSLQNPRWLIKNDNNIIQNHGLIIKPTSFKAKLVWSIAKILNIFSLFTVIFPYRMLIEDISLEKNMGQPELTASIIYTGAPGKFQKFSIQFMNQDYEIQHYLKLATREDAIERIKNEEKALKYLNKQNFSSMVVPRLIEIIYEEKFYGILQENIIHKNIMNLDISYLDITVINELYEVSKISYTTVGEYSAKILREFSLHEKLEDYKECLFTLKDRQIELVISHGDYIPWNRFIDDSEVKVIDWEMYSYRPIFYDIYFYIIHKAILIDDMDIEDIFLDSLNYFKKINNIDYNERTKIIYLFLISLEIYVHYKKNNQINDEKMLKALVKNMIFLGKKLEEVKR